MSRLLVVGNINLETTLRVSAFPIPYQSAIFVPFGIDSAISGVGYNLAKALSVLGDEVVLAGIIGRDKLADIIRRQLHEDNIDGRYVLSQVENTPQSLIAYDEQGQRAIFTDIKDVMAQTYPSSLFVEALSGVEVVLFTQAAYCRPQLATARSAGKLVATDLQLISDLDDPYKRPYMESADILFMSDEQLPEPPHLWARHLPERYPSVQMVGIGMGQNGALLALRGAGQYVHIPAMTTRPIVNTGGAGDALFASFMHYCASAHDPEEALRRAVLFASYKIGETGSSRGFLDAATLEALYGSL